MKNTNNTQNVNTVIDDPWASTENPQFRGNEFYGQINIDTYYCVLEKGTGKIPFDPQTHRIEDRRTAVEMLLLPIPEQNISFEVGRSTIAESRDWASITLPSIKNLGLSPRELNNRWVKLVFTATGKTYTNAKGEEKENTAIEFVSLYADEAACRADFTGGGSASATPASQATANGNDKDKSTALAFLKVVVDKALKLTDGSDLEKIRDVVAREIVKYPLVAKHFTVDSPETVELIAYGVAK